MSASIYKYLEAIIVLERELDILPVNRQTSSKSHISYNHLSNKSYKAFPARGK